MLSPHGDHRAEVLLEELRVLFERSVGVKEDDALLFEVFANLVVHHLRLVLSRNTGNEALTFGFGDAELLVGLADVFWQLFPRLGLLLGGAHEVLDVVEVDAAEVCTPHRHGLAREHLQPFEAAIEHPLRLVLQP